MCVVNWAAFSFNILLIGAFVIDETKIRLLNNVTDYKGILEVFNNNTWSTICPSFPTDTMAHAACRSLGFQTGFYIYNVYDALFSNLTNGMTGYNITCEVNSTSIANCTFGDVLRTSCKKSLLAVSCGEVKSCSEVLDSKFLRTTCQINNVSILMCPNGYQFYRELARSKYCIFSDMCYGDVNNYQTCGCPSVQRKDDKCHSSVCWSWDDKLISLPTPWYCTGIASCADGRDEIKTDCEPAHTCTGGSSRHVGWLPKKKLCDSTQDCRDGSDEVSCGHDFGAYCTQPNNTNVTDPVKWVEKRRMCDDKSDCPNGEDEMNCDHNKTFTCNGVDRITKKEKTYTIRNELVCSNPLSSIAIGDCNGLIDQMNCSHTNVLWCTIEGYINTRVRSLWVCDGRIDCDNEEDELACASITSMKCNIHKHRYCDGRDDCPDGLDEKNCVYTESGTCQRRYVLNETMILEIPQSWICDGVEDCINGLDEDKDKWGCDKGFICPGANNKKVVFKSLCDNEESCNGQESVMCHTSKGVTVKDTTIIRYDNHIYFPPCLPGLYGTNSSLFQCEVFNETYSDSTEVNHSFTSLTSPKRCSNIFGEQYLKLSCAGLCVENTTCPLQKIAGLSICTNEVNLVNYKLADDGTLKRLVIDDGVQDQYVFVCTNYVCLQRSKVCNLVDDCGDGSDELNCANSFKCKKGSPNYVQSERMCDGKYDCSDSSDECDEACDPKDIIHGIYMKLCAMAISIIATITNSVILVKSVILFNKKRLTKNRLFNTIFVNLIAVGDLCIGVYLLNIVIIDYRYQAEKYCTSKYQWLTSSHCSVLGVLSTFGSQLSLFAMVGLSVFRAYSMLVPFGLPHATKRFISSTAGFTTLTILMACFIAVFPMLNIVRDYFTNGLFYSNNTLFDKVVTLDKHLVIAKKYQELNNTVSDTLSNNWSWDTVEGFVTDGMFTKDYNSVAGEPIRFYGNDGVCLFKYFVSQDDPQIVFSLSILAINMVCFIIIVVAYLLILRTVLLSSRKTLAPTPIRGNNSVDIKKQKRKKPKMRQQEQLQRKTIMIIASDFLCWVPFCIICLLHTTNAFNATPYYQFFSVIFIPINSVINPLIYTNFGDYITRAKIKTRTFLTVYQSRDTVRDTLESNPAVTDTVELDATPTPKIQLTRRATLM